MKTIIGTSRKYLDIDLSSKKWRAFTIPEEFLDLYIGGKSMGLKLFYDRLGGDDGKNLKNIDPLGEDNILCFMMGSIMASGAPCSARFSGVTKSPLTNIMVTSSCGGPFGMACKTAGWDGVLVYGKSEKPCVINITENGVNFCDAGEIWGMQTSLAQKNLIDNPRKAALVIGPAGENKVLYAVIRSGNRYLGRGGMGAVMGAKNLKAIVATGMSYNIVPCDKEKFSKLCSKARKYMNRNDFVKNYRKYGTNFNVRPGIKSGFAPVRNFRDRTDPRCEAFSGEAMAERYHTEHSVCAPCSVLCGHKGIYPDGVERHIPEYETVGLWGGNIMNFDPDILGVWNEEMGELGLDTISAGGTVSWAMEAAEKGLRPSELAFGKTSNISKIIEDIAYCRGEGAELALGSKRLSEKYGGTEFASQVKGLEMAAYDPRAGWGQALNYAIANRGGCHLNSYPIALEALFNFIPQYSKLSKVSWVNFFEDLFTAINSMQTCQFSVFGYVLEPPVAKYTPKPILKIAMTFMPGLAQKLLDFSLLAGYLTAITGRKMSVSKFLKAGRRGHVLERYMNCLMGISHADDTLPKRFLTEAETKHPDKSLIPLEPLVRSYYRKKGYDQNGIPTPKTLRRLAIKKPKE